MKLNARLAMAMANKDSRTKLAQIQKPLPRGAARTAMMKAQAQAPGRAGRPQHGDN